MQRPSKPDYLTEMRKEIERFKDEKLNLDESQEEYKNKVGLSGHARNNLPFHPKALGNELKDIKEHFANLSENYMEAVAKKNFLQYMLQEPPLEISEGEQEQASAEESALKKEMERYILLVEELEHLISLQAQSVEQSRATALKIADKAIDDLDLIDHMEEEMARIEEKVSNQSSYTVEEAKALLNQQTDEIAKINRDSYEKKIRIPDMRWRVEDLEADIKQLEADLEKKNAEAEQAVINKRNRDREVEESYYHFLDATDLCNRLFGVETIKFESDSSVSIHYMKPKNSVLHVEIDTTSNQIHDAKVIIHPLDLNGEYKDILNL
ncbi:Mevalonate kinase [Mucor velutinosus]|uniref:Mevalonate kinase n=1 Tax=Mucor velutinosus TaxID=708070 RepID=A0AAN7DSD3_9FUNG|nr:Mevalonate kinase [Mucor velutinosus]